MVDYALDLKYFHKESEDKILVPILVSTNAEPVSSIIEIYDDNIVLAICCCHSNIKETIIRVINKFEIKKIKAEEWESSIYMPTPTIIEAAQALYAGHSVEEISRSDAGAINLKATTQAINEIIEESKTKNIKSICFITGVPGAGKTLADINITNERHQYDENEHAVFLSGNGPLVEVLQESLARNQVENSETKVKKSDALRNAKSFIQIVHHFRDEALRSDQPPTEKVVIFDEAQRAWTKKQTSKFMREKKGQSDFDMSEPEFLIDYVGRHKDWAVIICLIGGGQEINTGEAGLTEWFEALKQRHNNWNIYLSNEITDYEYVAEKPLSELLGTLTPVFLKELHLSVSLRSFRSENVSNFVKNLLDVNIDNSKDLYCSLKNKYSIVLTRDLITAKKWIRGKARGSERYGLVASSRSQRLKANGIWVKNKIKATAWFLNDYTDVRSSYYLEDVATEFDIQGLELDWALVAWGADYRFQDNKFIYKNFKGSKWMNINNIQDRAYLKNTYRVLLTRARQGMVLYVPEGDKSDATRPPKYYDDVFNYLKNIGIKEI